jgi:hypothetical protein
MSIRKIYEKHHGPIPQDYEIHHIIPKHADGTDDISNLVALSKEDHKKAHLERYDNFGDFRDLCAYHMINYNFTEAHLISSSEGGKIGGTKVYNGKVGIFRSDKERLLWASMGGKSGSRTQIEKEIGIHTTDEDLRKKWASMGGIASGVFQDPIRQSEFGKRGGAKNKGFKWYTDSDGNHKKYTTRQQSNENFEDFINRTQFLRGRK